MPEILQRRLLVRDVPKVYEMDSVQDALRSHRLIHHVGILTELGVTCLEDLGDLEEGDLKGFTVVEKRRFKKMVDSLQDLETIVVTNAPKNVGLSSESLLHGSQPSSVAFVKPQTVNTALELSSDNCGSNMCVAIQNVVKYCVLQPLFSTRKTKVLVDIDPSSTLRQLIQAICEQERQASGIYAQLYTPEGVPLSTTSVTAEFTLSDWKVTSCSFLWVIFHPVGITDDFSQPETMSPISPLEGPDQIFVKYVSTMVINIDSAVDSGNTLRQKIYSRAKIPTSVISLTHAGKIIPANDVKLAVYGIEKHSTVHMWCTPRKLISTWDEALRANSGHPIVEQTAAGMSAFNSCLHILKDLPHGDRLLGYLRCTTQSPPLILALKTLMKCSVPSKAQRIAIHEGLYGLFRALIPNDPTSTVNSGDDSVFESSPLCWDYLISNASEQHMVNECYDEISLICPICHHTMRNPVSYKHGGQTFDLDCLQNKLDINEAIPGLPASTSLDDFAPNLQMMQMVLACPTMQATSVTLWKLTDEVKAGTLPQPMNVQQITLAPISKLPSTSFMYVQKPLELKNHSVNYPCLTLNNQNMIVVCTGTGKGSRLTHYVYDPWTGESKLVCPDELAAKILHQTLRTRTKPSFVKEGVITRTPKEAIIVLLDCSGSMSTEVFGSISRLSVVQELFKTFADRSMAYNYHHVIGLTLFSETISVISFASESFAFFQTAIEDTKASGRTAIWDAFTEATNQLNTIGRKYPDCLKRVICLTDGEDNASKSKPHTVTKLLQESCIIVDCVLIGNENKTAKSVAIATNGCAFRPENHTDSLRLFQMETVLSIRERQMVEKKPLILSHSTLLQFASEPYATKPPRKMPSELIKTVTTPQHILRKAAMNPPKGFGAPSINRVKRILWELASYQRDPHPSVEIYPCEEQVDFWRCLLSGPDKTPYEKGVFLLYLRFPEKYPQQPPELRFETPIYHCNVNGHGKVCHSVFDRNYSTSTSVRLVMNCVYGLLLSPEPDDPLDSALAEEYYLDKIAYEATAREMTSSYASKKLNVWREELVGSEERPLDTPVHLVCPLTGKLMKDPVITPYGHTYERSAIESQLEISKIDPKTGKPLTKDLLYSNASVLEAIRDFERTKNQTQWYELD